MSIVSLARAHGSFSFKKAIERSLDLLDFDLGPGVSKVVIKPNLCYYMDFSTGETTDPRFVAALVDVLRERISSDIDIRVVESDASAMKCKFVFQMLGYRKMSDEKKVELVNLSEDSATESLVKVAGRQFKFMVPKTIEKADLFINVPKIKFVPSTKITCALKNIYGCNPYPKKYRLHPVLDEAIVGLNKVMKPHICLTDGTTVRGVYTRRLGLVMASIDPVANDSVVATIGGIKPTRIGHVALAQQEGLGTTDFNIVGDDLGYFIDRFPRQDWKSRLLSKVIPVVTPVLAKVNLSL